MYTAGDLVTNLTGTWTSKPPTEDFVEQAYILHVPGHDPPYLDQRSSAAPDANIQIVLDTERANVFLVVQPGAEGYYATRHIKQGEELLMAGSWELICATILHQAARRTPRGEWTCHTMYVAPSTIAHAHLGLFARVCLPSGYLLGQYFGTRKCVRTGGAYEFLVRDNRGGGYVIDGQRPCCSSILRFVNHKRGRQANVIFQQLETMGVVAFTLCPIGPDTELFVDYGTNAKAIIRAGRQPTSC